MLRALALSAALIWTAVPVWAEARVSVLMDVLRVAEIAQILSNEGMQYGQELDIDMLGGAGGAGFHLQVRAIHAPQRISESIRSGLVAKLSPEQIEDVIAFYAAPVGSEIVKLENQARVAFSDAEIEEGARARYTALEDSDPARYALIERLISAGDLVSRNVTSSMNSNIAFLRGLADGDLIALSEEEMLSDVAGDMEMLEEDTRGWLGGFMTLAYSPLSDADLELYAKFTETPAGAALNTGFFAGFDPLYEEISYALGRAVALNSTGEDL